MMYLVITNLLYYTVIAAFISIVAVTYCNILTEPHKIFAPVYNLLEKILPDWLFDPIIGCEKCFAGQAALWSFMYWNFYSYRTFEERQLFNLVFTHIYFICATIFITSLTNLVYRWQKRLQV